MDWTLQSKDRDWQNGLKKKTQELQLYANYKKLSLDPKAQEGWKWKDRKIYPMQIVTKREQGQLY